MLLTEVYAALTAVCKINWYRNYEDHPRPTSALVCEWRDRRESKVENEMTLLPRRILQATDGSEEAELTARVAVELAKSTDSELHLVHVKLLPLTPPYPDVLDWRWREDLERAEREARELLDEQVEKVEDAGGTVAGIHLREEEPAEEIIALAKELGVSLIVVGSRDRGRIRRALAGSVSDWVVRHAHCPVLVVRSHKGADNRARLSRRAWTARSEASKEASAQALRH
jgi:nucleotide-binding universal stress UspA family protein